ncbi:DUF4124 domain-containing protein [Simiduia curdlanivorans]|uniref:DUF4124 domain-containing protein n=1 Tax=Simiduia curdlanivorans TaxID=1492769 RepID=A0ABV8VA70_9GAMM|nr:DUF4124 domain-containing protein [Simiduia curdlanivorans]MDN3639532.1 DUF4124 domain-containing protein [Simiduia curdlanivorans]
MTRLLAACLLVLAVVANANAAKLYKIVDEHGNITFSQYPPKEKSENTVVEGVEVRGAGAAETVRYAGSSAYCGDIRLPRSYTGSSARSSEYRAEYMSESVTYWREKLQRLEQSAQRRSREKLNSSNSGYGISSTAERNSRYQQQLDEDAKEMRELRCALNWADKESTQNAEVLSEGQSENKRLQTVHDELSRKMVNECGREPLLDPTDSTNAKSRRQWKACTKKYRKGLDDVESELYRR